MSANFAYVSSSGSEDNTGNPQDNYSLPALDVAAGRLLVVGFRWEGGGVSDPAAVTSITDTAGNTYQPIGVLTNSGAEDEKIVLFCTLSSLAHASNVVDIQIDGDRAYWGGFLAQYSYSGTIQIASPTGTGSNSSDTTSVTSSPAYSALSGDLIVGWLGHYNSAPTFTPTSPFTARDSLSFTAYIDHILVTNGSHTPGGTFSGGGDTYAILTAHFKEAGGGVAMKRDVPRATGGMREMSGGMA